VANPNQIRVIEIDAHGIALLTARPAHSQTLGPEALASVVAVQQAARLDRATMALVCEAHETVRRSRQRRQESAPAPAGASPS